MNSDRVDEVAALREQKQKDRAAEDQAREAKMLADEKSHKANMERIAKKMARIAAGGNSSVEEALVEEPVAEKEKPAPAPAKKKAAVKSPPTQPKAKSKAKPKAKLKAKTKRSVNKK